jgi:regulator of cell morphogenesis and NO signaling
MSLGEVVNAYPALAAHLERLELDYCCGGTTALADACRVNELDPEAVVIELAAHISADAAPAPWSSMGAVELVDHIVDTHHRYLCDELPRLQALVDKVLGVHGDRHPELADIATCFGAIRADIEPHLTKEEQVLFPAIGQLADADEIPAFGFGSVGNPISMMLREHDDLGELLRQLRSLTTDYTPPADGCASYSALFAGLEQLEADTHLHVHKENNLLFPQVIELEQQRTS